MMERRDVVGGGLLGFTALLGGGGAAEAPQRDDDSEAARAIDRFRESIANRLDAPFPELREIRREQRIFLKANYKYPDFIEIGVNAWDRLYDWHIRHQLTPAIVRRDDGRYTMSFMFTTLILRPEMMDNYVGFGFDLR